MPNPHPNFCLRKFSPVEAVSRLIGLCCTACLGQLGNLYSVWQRQPGQSLRILGIDAGAEFVEDPYLVLVSLEYICDEGFEVGVDVKTAIRWEKDLSSVWVR